MPSATHRSEPVGESWRPAWEADPPEIDRSTSFIRALFAGGDSRIATNPRTGLNKYLCPEEPAPDLVCASSCTASPISVQGFQKAADAWFDIAQEPVARQRAHRLMALTREIEARLLRYFKADGLARAILCPSGTDAVLTTAMLIAEERPDEPMTAILPAASETGTGVPLAAMGRVFDGPESGMPLIGAAGTTVEIPLRWADGSPRREDEVNDAFTAATKALSGNVIVYLTHGTKTGLIAPVSPPRGVNVIVDACQARIGPDTVAAYLRKDWPVVVTGSKFFGGPAFSGAVLYPLGRSGSSGKPPLPSDGRYAAELGTALRWTAAMNAIDDFEPLIEGMAAVLSNRAASIEQELASNPMLVPIGGPRLDGSGWAGHPTIFTFGVRDHKDRGRMLTATELRPLYERLARLGVLLGQPVGLGRFGGLRIAIGARDLLNGPDDDGMARVFGALTDVTKSP
jgi:hypothetical protein